MRLCWVANTPLAVCVNGSPLAARRLRERPSLRGCSRNHPEGCICIVNPTIDRSIYMLWGPPIAFFSILLLRLEPELEWEKKIISTILFPLTPQNKKVMAETRSELWSMELFGRWNYFSSVDGGKKSRILAPSILLRLS